MTCGFSDGDSVESLDNGSIDDNVGRRGLVILAHGAIFGCLFWVIMLMLHP